VALALLAAPAGLRGCPGRRRAGLELSQGVEDLRTIGAAYFQASLIADREGHWVLARNYAERAREAYGQLADRVHVSQLTNNLGGLNFLLGNTDQAVKLLKESFAIALDLGRDADAGRAVSSLAQVHLRTGSVELAEDQARQALDLLDGRVDYVDEIGSAQLVLGRSLLEQGRLDEAEAAFVAAETSYGDSDREAIARPLDSHAATCARGGITNGAELYRTAAEASGRPLLERRR
jgi:tetratricopeptide (TPR) repeat protein